MLETKYNERVQIKGEVDETEKLSLIKLTEPPMIHEIIIHVSDI